MNPNYFIFSWTQMMAYVQMDQEMGGNVNWAGVFKLEKCPPISFIQVIDDNNPIKVLVSAGWT